MTSNSFASLVQGSAPANIISNMLTRVWFLKRNHAKGEVCRQENNRKAIRKTIGSCLPQENNSKVFHQILQTGPPSLSVPPGLPEPNDVSMAWLCHRSYEAMTEVRPRLYRAITTTSQPTPTQPDRVLMEYLRSQTKNPNTKLSSTRHSDKIDRSSL